MLELARQCGFRECAEHHVSTPGIPGNLEAAGQLLSCRLTVHIHIRLASPSPGPGLSRTSGTVVFRFRDCSMDALHLRTVRGFPARGPLRIEPYKELFMLIAKTCARKFPN
jgi:hypothetical protein